MNVTRDPVVSVSVGRLVTMLGCCCSQNMGIKDDFHQKTILACIEELCHATSASATLSEAAVAATPNSSSGTVVNEAITGGSGSVATGNSPHTLMPQSFSVLEKCDKCHKYLRGLLHQGFLCLGTCEASIHRWPDNLYRDSVS